MPSPQHKPSIHLLDEENRNNPYCGRLPEDLITTTSLEEFTKHPRPCGHCKSTRQRREKAKLRNVKTAPVKTFITKLDRIER